MKPSPLKALTYILTIGLTFASCQQKDAEPEFRRAGPESQIVRIATASEPHSLDPRQARMLCASTVLGLMFEGLMRHDTSGKLEPGVAQSVELSDDRTTYTFHLRESSWSNGDPVTAEDFVYSWKSLLAPDFPAPNAFQLYSIKNAQASKAGLSSLDDVAIYAKDSHTLVVELEKPTPYFLDLTAFHAFFPINSKRAREHTDWAENLDHFTSNGPFRLVRWAHSDEMNVTKNPHYWDAHHVQLHGVSLVVGDEHTAMELFHAHELEWTGSPLSIIPPDAIASMTERGALEIRPAAATEWLRVNVDHPVLSHVQIRKALSLAIDRYSLTKYVIQGNQTPAKGILPPSPHWQSPAYFQDDDVVAARRFLQEGLVAMGISLEELPPIILSYRHDKRNHRLAQALQQQWQEALGIRVNIEATEGKLLYEKLRTQDYQLANGSWFADFSDPINFLSVFDAKGNGTNNTGWEDARYQELLAESSMTADPDRRQELLLEAEALIMEELPVIPIFFYSLNYLKSPQLKGVGLTDLGVLNLRNAYLVPERN